ncbi:MAG: hypothetical protein R3A47_04225 [Polyangiales bacterium]
MQADVGEIRPKPKSVIAEAISRDEALTELKQPLEAGSCASDHQIFCEGVTNALLVAGICQQRNRDGAMRGFEAARAVFPQSSVRNSYTASDLGGGSL